MRREKYILCRTEEPLESTRYEAIPPKYPGKTGSPYRHFWHVNQGEAYAEVDPIIRVGGFRARVAVSLAIESRCVPSSSGCNPHRRRQYNHNHNGHRRKDIRVPDRNLLDVLIA
jgi:hypothetical protein